MKVCNPDGGENRIDRRNISGKRVRQMRIEKCLSQSYFAARVQVLGVILEQESVSRIEHGQRMVQDYELRAMAQVLGVTADWLMQDEESEG